MMVKDMPDFEKPALKKSLFERLLNAYVEEKKQQQEKGDFNKESMLLQKIVKEDDLGVLIVNLYPGSDGYSLMLKKKDGSDVETYKLPYEESEFLDYLDTQELPPLLVDVLESAQVDLFYDGCVIVELRDYRRSTQKNFDTTYILLKPTSQTIVRDVNSLMSDPKWSNEDKAKLESQLVLAMQPRLCLDPSPKVLYTANKIQHHANKWNHKGLRRSMKRFSQPYLNRAYLCSHTPSPPCLKLLDFIKQNKDKRSSNSFHKLSRATQHTDMWKQRQLNLSVPSKIDVTSHAKLMELPKYTTDYTPEKIQEIILEGEKTNNRSYYCRVTIQRRGSTGEYIGDLYLEEDHGKTKEDTKKDGRACRFSLVNRITAQRYLQQFQELYTEEGRKSVKISTFVANQAQRNQQQQQQQAQNSNNASQQAKTQAQQQQQQTAQILQQAAHQAATQKIIVSSVPTSTTQMTTHTIVNQNRTFTVAQNPVISHGGNTYILASSALQQSLNLGSNVVPMSLSRNPYIVNSSGNLQQAVSTKTNQSPSKIIGASNENAQLTTAYIQSVSGATIGGTSHGQLTAVPIAVQGNNVSLVPGNQFIAAKASPQTIRPAGATGQIMLQVPGNLVPLSQMTRVAGGPQKGQIPGAGMASVMVHGKQVMVQGGAMIQGQATFIPNQAPLIPGLQGGQTAIIQGGSIFVQGQPGQTQGQTVMIQGQPGQHQTGQNTLIQGQALQGQPVFIQGQPNGQTQVVQGQAIMLQGNQGGHQGQVQLITTSTSSGGQQLQIVPQIQKQAVITSSAGRTQSSTALSALTSQVNLIPMQQSGQQYQPIVQFTTSAQPRPVQQRRKSASQPNAAGGGRKRAPAPTKPSPQSQ
ncbi:transcription factor SPT20 homolog isoform X3 [Clytia hemisphaerica]